MVPQGTLCKTIDALTPMGDFHVCLSTFKLLLLNLTQYFLLSPISLKCGSLSVPFFIKNRSVSGHDVTDDFKNRLFSDPVLTLMS